MRTKFLFLSLFLVSAASYGQEIHFKEYSYTEFFGMIEEEKDTIFDLKDAIIRFNEKTDSAFIVKSPFLEPVVPIIKSPRIVIDKAIKLENVHFETKFDGEYDTKTNIYANTQNGVLNNIQFKENVEIRSITSFELHNSVIEKEFYINNRVLCNKERDFWRDLRLPRRISIGNNKFKNGLNIISICADNTSFLLYQLFDNIIQTEKVDFENNKGDFFITNRNDWWTLLRNSIIGNGEAKLIFRESEGISISNNSFSNAEVRITMNKIKDGITFRQNIFKENLVLGISDLNPSDIVDWDQFKDRFYSYEAFEGYRELLPDNKYYLTERDSFKNEYLKTIRFQNPEVYAGETAQRGVLYRHYRANFDMVNANRVYIDLKDLETRRLRYLFNVNPSFDTYFQWKVNQFLKVFSNYGTKPSKAIVYSVYVIMFFGFIYLFFPNSWDSHGRKRIMDRFRFFTKYMNKEAGIHEVYLDEKKEELLDSEDFRDYMLKSEKGMPKFFLFAAMPLYKWSVSGTKISASLLKRIDVMKGRWKDLPKTKRLWKSVLLIGAFLIAICYDLFIKVLNALMLSINTFTTLGFGEIPIKGLPRYLAIIQGFIGWFMLTIFSVSLISQLLN